MIYFDYFRVFRLSNLKKGNGLTFIKFYDSFLLRSQDPISFIRTFFFFFQFNYAVVMVEKTWLFEW